MTGPDFPKHLPVLHIIHTLVRRKQDSFLLPLDFICVCCYVHTLCPFFLLSLSLQITQCFVNKGWTCPSLVWFGEAQAVLPTFAESGPFVRQRRRCSVWMQVQKEGRAGPCCLVSPSPDPPAPPGWARGGREKLGFLRRAWTSTGEGAQRVTCSLLGLKRHRYSPTCRLCLN